MSHSRRTFIRDASALAAGAGCLTFGDLGGLMGHARSYLPGRLRIPGRPFNILAFGDSIMWGQGLREDQKFATLVKNWVTANMLGRAVTFESFAHSGARIMPHEMDGAAPFAGEVPSKFPSVHKQLYRALDSLKTRKILPSEIDLVLLNGGINDIGITSILSPFASSGSITDLTRDSITGHMNYLLPAAAGMFGNAKFIVPGYFPIVTEDSATPEVTALLGVVSAVFGLPVILFTPWIKQQLIANCRAFFTEADAGLRAAVTAQNGRTPNRCVFADPGFSLANGYGASDRFLFNTGESDPMVVARKASCDVAGQGSDLTCTSASMGHPNVNGAIKYASAMNAGLAGFLTEWQALRKLFACIEPKPVAAVSADYTVWVEDAVTRLPVSASVMVGERAVPANASFTYTFACTPSEPETLDGKRGLPGRTITPPPTCDRIMVTASDYLPYSVRWT
jgi:lysophospholipase L1-like esterase